MVRWLGRVAPELDLTSNRALCDLRSQPGIENEFVGYLDGLAHRVTVAFCYQVGKAFASGFPPSAKRRNRRSSDVARQSGWLFQNCVNSEREVGLATYSAGRVRVTLDLVSRRLGEEPVGEVEVSACLLAVARAARLSPRRGRLNIPPRELVTAAQLDHSQIAMPPGESEAPERDEQHEASAIVNRRCRECPHRSTFAV